MQCSKVEGLLKASYIQYSTIVEYTATEKEGRDIEREGGEGRSEGGGDGG